MKRLSDYHIHTNFSDGRHSMRELIDTYGKAGFHSIAITDHLCESKTFLGKAANLLDKTLTKDNFTSYIETIKEEGERAKWLYDMVVIPGFEVTKNSFRHSRSAHVLALGVDSFIDPDLDLVTILKEIKNRGGVTVAAHPVSTRKMEPQTYYLWDHRDELRSYFDAWEVASGPILFNEVAEENVPMIANSDLHQMFQMTSWKTYVNCEGHQGAILDSIRKQQIEFEFYSCNYQPLAM